MKRLSLLAALLLAGCGGSAPDRAGQDVDLLLGARPGAVHAPIAIAIQRGFDEAEGVQLRPGDERATKATLVDHPSSLGILTPAQLAKAPGLVAVMAYAQKPSLLLVTLRETLTDDPAVVKGAVHAIQRGEREAYIDPESAVSALIDLTEGQAGRFAALAKQLDRLGTGFQGDQTTYGRIDRKALRRAGVKPAQIDDGYVTAG